ncbi:LysR family transcriptional regulator [Bacillus sp. DTU_2020_1000418_1_SI_GHA_SEK_038]|uniref:LysR family transcriptional regulator n=1 Tax=Bacillus sp. DTU_2020_1000418_1_SI_GHA_SEK_038 TaxID=3077585 RepID=UPI0028EF6E00|nr:LysR family transcriptional regulator [Bacillus sp. DTU_2020_1000418_1_SI_GHA_SEK_038]WNS76268.1 LysR family transcriptional regulator [Bacillus sp. DTU_2020_1000418_1_SI_GHA_SEK_038]
MELRDLKSFMEVADYKSFTNAAAHSYLTQPSLSKAVKKLEEELNVELFDRSTRHLRLTDAGQIVYRQSQKAFASLSELNVLLDELRDITSGEIKIGIPPLIGTLFFPKIAQSFNEKYPKVSLELVELGAKLIGRLIEEASIDVAIVVLPSNEETFNIYPFFQDEFVLFLHEDHPFAKRDTISINELKDEKFILFSEDFTLHDYIIQACEKEGFSPIVSYQSSQWDLILELVSAKLGITLLPKIIYEKQSNQNVKIVKLENPTLYWNLGIITKKGAYHSYALKELLKMLNLEFE